MIEKLSNLNSFSKKKYIVADFHKLETMTEYREQIGSHLKDLNVGVLVINAGFGSRGAFVDQYDSEIEKAF